MPGKADFGIINIGKEEEAKQYEMTVTVINEDIMAQRINIKLKKRLAKRREKDELLVYCKESGPVNKILLIKIFKFF